MLIGQKIRNGIRCFFFILIFCILLYGVNELLAEKWWYPMFTESPAYQYRELYETDLSDLQAVFLGTSHMEMAVNPMQIYKEKGFVTFNLASSSQPAEGSYYVLEEIFRLSNPRYVFFDVGKLFSSSGYTAYRLLFENLQWGLPKLKFIKKWAMLTDEEKRLERLISAFFPLLEYHDRWENLTEQDYINEAGKRHYYRKGYYLRPTIGNTDLITAERMNWEAEQRYQKTIRSTVIENGEETTTEKNSKGTYNPVISNGDQEMIVKIAELCQRHGAQLVLVKIPSIRFPQKYLGAWTQLRSDKTKELAELLNVEFYDLLYDYDLGLDWEKDTFDNGMHLNYSGAMKATRFFEEYLESAGLKSISCASYDEDIDVYNKVCRLAELMEIRDFDIYFQKIRNLKNVSILLAVRDDMRNRLSQEDIDLIKGLGVQTRIEDMKYSDAFVAVIDNGKSIYEASSSTDIDCEGVLSDGTPYQLFSSGFQEKDDSKIIIDGTDYSYNQRGINVVIYDHESGLVIDTASFDTWASDNPKTSRVQTSLNNIFRDYEEWCMRQSYEEKQ